MLGVLNKVKNQLSHIQDTDWHFKVVNEFWNFKGGDAGKACTYYWFKLPFAMLAWCVVGLMIIIACAGGLLLGFIPTLGFKTSNEEMQMYYIHSMFYPYKHLPNGTRVPVAPWEIALAAALLYGVYYLAFVDQGFGIVVGAILLGIGLLGSILWAVSSNWNNPLLADSRSAVSDAWNKVCPNLVVEHVDKEGKGEK